MRFLLTLLIVACCMASTVPTGVASPLPEPGARIRLTARMPERERWIGPFVSIAHDSVTMHAGDLNGSLVAVPTLHIERFEISRGDRPNGLRGASVGFVVGALLGAGVGYAGTNSGNSGNDLYGAGFNAAAGAAALGVIGTAIGAAIGAGSPSERWRALPLEDLRGAARP
jgi:hypothetical protein